MSRRYPRIRALLTATVSLIEHEARWVCRTRDISARGCFLDTHELIEPGTKLLIALMDEDRGIAMEIEGEVARCLPAGPDGRGRGLGVRFDQPPAEWNELIASYHERQERERRARRLRRMRLRILVVGEEARQRGAMALYVTSGWDVRFASDFASAEDALLGVNLDAIIIETDGSIQPWQGVLSSARRIQPDARRIVRAPAALDLPPDPARDLPLVHVAVERDAGLDALVDALVDPLPGLGD
ncbi:PilZ domain-containing protein [Haliangium sp.]|uniref:PilZ domain-containing protein n=1 Tax=Haliangium sp. TaxID=2663208 RepID=UPI003D0F955A